MRKLFLLSMVVIILILMVSVKTATAQVVHLCNTAAGRKMPIVTWDRLSFKAEGKSPVLEWSEGRC